MLRIGNAGIPDSTPTKGIVAGTARAAEVGFGVMELEFVHSIYMTPDLAKRVGEVAKKAGLALTVHAPFYINLNSPEPAKRHASM